MRRLGTSLRCVFFFLIFVFIFLLINVLFYLYRLYPTKYATERVMGGRDDENGPNDAGCVVWATSKCFFNANGIQIVFHLKYLTCLTMYLIISEKSYLS